MHNVKSDFSESVRRLLRPLVKIMMREGITYSDFASIARMAFVESATFDFGSVGTKTPASAVCALAGISSKDLVNTLNEMDQFDASQASTIGNPYAVVLHGWYNDREYVGPYGFPVDLPFVGNELSFTALAERYAPNVSPEIVLQELIRMEAVKEVGNQVWKPLKQEFIDPTLNPENLKRMASLVESVLATLENNTRGAQDGEDLFERTTIVDLPLTRSQLHALQAFLKVVGGQFMQRVDSFSAVDLQRQDPIRVGEVANLRAGVQCFLYVEPKPDWTNSRAGIDFKVN